MHMAVISVLIGESVITRSVTLAEYAVAVLIGFHTFVRLYEEPTLRQFGAAYEQCCATVPRWIGR